MVSQAGIAARRLSTQRLADGPFDSPAEAVRWLTAVQSQDYLGAKWALAMRTRGVTDAGLDRLFDEGTILRTHVLRPTWHFVLPDDIRWLLDLTAPRVKAMLATYDRRHEVDPALIRRTEAVFESVLESGRFMTRADLGTALQRAGIEASGLRLGHLVMHAELDAVLASGPRRGREHTYALLAERAPGARRLDRDEALAELTRRYFTSHGPAQVQDLAWWSGLTAAEVVRGLDMVGRDLAREEVDGRVYWSADSVRAAGQPGAVVRLLPNFDEFLVGYRDRSAALVAEAPLPFGGLLGNVVVVDGQVRGGWRRSVAGGRAAVELGPLAPLDAAAARGLRREAERFGEFLGLPLTITP